MIVVDVQEYCDECLDFRPDVKHPERLMNGLGEIIQSDTVIRCTNAGRCEGIKRYLERRMKGEK